MSLTNILTKFVDALSGLLNAMKKMAEHILRTIGSLLDDSPIGWGYREEDRFAVSTDGRWVDREKEQYGEWMVASRVG